MFNYARSLLMIWNRQTLDAFTVRMNFKLNVNKIFLIIIMILLWSLFFLIWIRMFLYLSSNSKWVNGYIVLIPLKLIQENKHLKNWLKRKMKMKSLLN